MFFGRRFKLFNIFFGEEKNLDKQEFNIDTGFDPETSQKQAEKTIQRLKDNLKSN